MANDNAQGAIGFRGDQPPPAHQVTNVHDGTAEPGLDATSEVNYAAIQGKPLPVGKGRDTYVDMPGDGITPG